MTVIENKALIDKIVFYNGRITKIPYLKAQRLLNEGIMEKNVRSKARYYYDSVNWFTKLEIKNSGYVDKLRANSSIHFNKKQDSMTLTTSIHDEESSNINCFNVNQYKDRINVIQNQLLNNYGIRTDFSQLKIKEIEINRTFTLDNKYNEYYRVVNLFFGNLPKKMSYIQDNRNTIVIDKNHKFLDSNCITAKSTKNGKSNDKKRYTELKFYNKTRQLEGKAIITDSYMRVELKLVGAEVIQRKLKTNVFSKLTDDIVNNFFDEQIYKLLVKPYCSWKVERDKELLALMEQQRRDDVTHWQTNVLRYLTNIEIEQRGKPMLLDINELLPLVNEMNLNKNRRYDIKANFKRQAQKHEKVFCNDDDKKLIEIIEKLQRKENVIALQKVPSTIQKSTANIKKKII